MTTISYINALPSSPFVGTGLVPIVITNGIPSYFQVIGSDLSGITSVNWYPENQTSVKFATRQMILVDDTQGTFMIRVTDNYLSICNRGGHISFQLTDGSTVTFPVVTYGPVSAGPLWTSPEQGLVTGLD